MSHPNQHIIDAIAKGKKVYWKYIRHGSLQDSGFFDESSHGSRFIALIKNDKDYQYTIMPDMVTVGNIEVVAPLKTVKANHKVFITESDGSVSEFCSAAENDYTPFISNRSAFHTREAALAYRNAIKILLK